jgi:3-hydroxyacyl-[acyl-carrier-protein] dehydratase
VKLINDLFEITESSAHESGFITTIKLFPGHIVYEGHFPGHPITPGVMQLQIVHELIETHFGKTIKLIAVDDCKFLKIVNPEQEKELRIAVEFAVTDSVLHVRAMGKHDADTFLKLRGTYQFI